MPNVPEACQALAAEVAALEQADATLRASLTTLVGPAAWAALASLGQGRSLLARKRRELDSCILQHTAALQANLVVMDLSGTPAEATRSRIAYLWDADQPGAPRESAVIHNHVVGFSNQAPAKALISVATTGAPDIHGPDFRSSAIDTSNAQSPLRIELLITPELAIYPEDVAAWLTASPPAVVVEVANPMYGATASVASIEAKLVAAGLEIRASGPLLITSLGSQVQSTTFSAGMTVRVVPTAAPDSNDLCDALVVGDLQLQSGGFLDSVTELVLPFVKDQLKSALAAQLAKLISQELHWHIAAAGFAIAGFPQGASVSLRRISIDPTAIRVQAAIGALGTTLSTYVPPQFLPP